MRASGVWPRVAPTRAVAARAAGGAPARRCPGGPRRSPPRRPRASPAPNTSPATAPKRRAWRRTGPARRSQRACGSERAGAPGSVPARSPPRPACTSRRRFQQFCSPAKSGGSSARWPSTGRPIGPRSAGTWARARGVPAGTARRCVRPSPAGRARRVGRSSFAPTNRARRTALAGSSGPAHAPDLRGGSLAALCCGMSHPAARR
jgi:hypothetical protein